MKPTYTDKQLAILKRHGCTYSHGDVIAFFSDKGQVVMLKRIGACPGDKAMIRNGTLYVNGKVSSVYEQTGAFLYAGLLEEEILLKEGEYLVFGDNLKESQDSRYESVGVIRSEDILGEILQ